MPQVKRRDSATAKSADKGGPKSREYRLVKGAGPHDEGGVRYFAGDAFTSTRDLIHLYPNKFEVVKEHMTVEEEAEEKREAGEKIETFTPYDTVETEKARTSAVFEKPTITAPKDEDEEGDDDDEKEEETFGGTSGRKTTNAKSPSAVTRKKR